MVIYVKVPVSALIMETNNLSVDCDCDSSPEDPRMGDIGILARHDGGAFRQDDERYGGGTDAYGER